MLFGSFIIHVHLLDLVLLYKPLNISGVPFNTTKPKLDGRVEGGKPANIVYHPHQVKFLN